MAINYDMTKYVFMICDKHGLGPLYFYDVLNEGFNRVSYSVNDKYMIKICINSEKEPNVMNEINFYENHSGPFNPRLIGYDVTK